MCRQIAVVYGSPVQPDSGQLLGYLLYGGQYPALKVFQLFVAPLYRGMSIAQKLITELVEFGERNSYLTISARVAADLPANRFWDRAGFPTVRQLPGGESSKRTINVRVRTLDTPSLLKMMGCETAVPRKGLQSLKLRARPLVSSQIYVLDLNVFFDVVKRRVHREEAGRLIASGLKHEIRIYVTPEFTAELERHSKVDRPDPILEFARQLPTLPSVESQELERLVTDLKLIIFPGQGKAEISSPQSQSDLLHLAYCLHHRVTGFITRDRAILSKHPRVQEKFAIEVLSPADLMKSAEISDSVQEPVRAFVGNESVSISPLEEQKRTEVENFLEYLGVDSEDSAEALQTGFSPVPRRRMVAHVGDQLVMTASWDGPDALRRRTALHLYVDERFPRAEMLIDHVFESVLQDSKSARGQLVILHVGLEQTKTLSTALKRGFLSSLSNEESPSRGQLSKFAFRGPISSANWDVFSRDFRELTGFRLSERIPNVEEFVNTGVALKDHADKVVCYLNLFDFETLVSPGIVMCPGRQGLIAPIRAKFAKDLLATAEDQPDLFPAPEALLHVEKAYFRHPQNASAFKRGILVLFYMSGQGGGTKEVLGCGRITYSEVLRASAIGLALYRQGVLPRQKLEEIADSRTGRIHVFTFDNFNHLPARVPFHVLKSEKIISGANLVTVERLSSRKLVKVFELGFSTKERH